MYRDHPFLIGGLAENGDHRMTPYVIALNHPNFGRWGSLLSGVDKREKFLIQGFRRKNIVLESAVPITVWRIIDHDVQRVPALDQVDLPGI